MIRKIIAAAAGVLAAGGIALATTGAASAAPLHHHPKVAIAHVEIGGGYEQYADVFAVTGLGPNHGVIGYTNFQYPDANSNVWSLVNAPAALDFVYLGTHYTHTLFAGATLKAISEHEVQFSDTGQYPQTGPAADTWVIKGDVKGKVVTFTIVYQTGNTPYSVNGTGTIANDGSATGTATSSASQALTWSLPAGTFQRVLHYVAPVTHASIHVPAQNAAVSFTIPAGHPFAGTDVDWSMHNGGSPALDTWAQGVFHGPQTAEPVEAGVLADF